MEQEIKKKISRLIITPGLIIISGIIGYNIGLNKEKDEKTLLEGSLQKTFYTEINNAPAIVRSQSIFGGYQDILTNAPVNYQYTENLIPIYQEIPADILFLPDNQEGKKELVKYLQEKNLDTE